MNTLKYSVKNIRNSLIDDKLEKEIRTNIVGYWTYRQLSFIVTPVFLTCSFSALGVTMIGFLFSLLMPIAAFWGGRFAFLYVALLGFISLLLDHVDGNIARITKKSIKLGQFLDSFVGNIYWVLLYISLGILVDHRNELLFLIAKIGLILGMLTAIIHILAKETRSYVKVYFPESFPDELARVSIMKSLLSSAPLLIPVFLVLVGFWDLLLYLLLLSIFVYNVLIFLYTLYSILRSLSLAQNEMGND